MRTRLHKGVASLFLLIVANSMADPSQEWMSGEMRNQMGGFSSFHSGGSSSSFSSGGSSSFHSGGEAMSGEMRSSQGELASLADPARRRVKGGIKRTQRKVVMSGSVGMKGKWSGETTTTSGEDLGDTIEIVSNGEGGVHQGKRMGIYTKTKEVVQGHPVYQQKLKELSKRQYLFVGPNGSWRVGPDTSTYRGSALKSSLKSPTPPRTGWQYRNYGKWIKDSSIQVRNETMLVDVAREQIGCRGGPRPPSESTMKCFRGQGKCEVTCKEGYGLPDGTSKTILECFQGQWRLHGNSQDSIPDCSAVCSPPCENRGICIRPGVCYCGKDYEGARCELEKGAPCLETPPTPRNSKVFCSENECTATCLPDHTFPDLTTSLTIGCEDGHWAAPAGSVLPNCQPTCHPTCENGGACLSFNKCQCGRSYRGDRCQSLASNCGHEKLHFNGNFNCSGTMDHYTCAIQCPAGIEMDGVPAPQYVCDYATGQFTPPTAPQCIYGSNVIISKTHKHSASYYNTQQQSGGSSIDWNIIMSKGVSAVMDHAWYSQLGSTWVMGQGMIPGQHSVDWSMSWTTPKYRRHALAHAMWISYGHITHFTSPEFQQMSVLLSEPTQAQRGQCAFWSGSHYKMFDGTVLSLPRGCSHTLITEPTSQTFQVNVAFEDDCSGNNGCPIVIHLVIESEKFDISVDRATGKPIVVSGDQSLKVPGETNGIVFLQAGPWLFVDIQGLGFKIRWNLRGILVIDAEETLWGKTSGLCGSMNGNPYDDFLTSSGEQSIGLGDFASSWEDEQHCESELMKESHECHPLSPMDTEAKTFCKAMIDSEQLKPCHSVLNPLPYYESCRWSYCADHAGNIGGYGGNPVNEDDANHDEGCDSVASYVRACANHGVNIKYWRTASFCPLPCSNGMEYRSCGNGESSSCGQDEEEEDPEFCVEGCYCPKGTSLHNGHCIPHSQCPCYHNKKEYASGSIIDQDCNQCTCQGSTWTCSNEVCGKRCSAVGDPHYVTFDGKAYDFMGVCSYTLVQHRDFSIEAENIACDGSISADVVPSSFRVSHPPSCTKSVTIKAGANTLRLKQRMEVLYNGKEAASIDQYFSFMEGQALVSLASSLWMTVSLPNGVMVWWDGKSRLYIDVPGTFKGHGILQGLCGTFDGNQGNDFLTPDGDLEENALGFANKWKVEDRCVDAQQSDHACDLNPLNRAKAEEHCLKIKGDLFKNCHNQVDPETFYQNCLFDMCSCDTSVANCLCPIFSSYGDACVEKGVQVDWRHIVRECGLHCHSGEQYQICGDSCSRSCRSRSLNPQCESHCVEGCNCPPGHTLDDEDQCVPISTCPCMRGDTMYEASSVDFRPDTGEICTCEEARWSCHQASYDEEAEYQRKHQLRCEAKQNMVLDQCPPMIAPTCHNMHHPVEETAEENCTASCVCKPGHVVNSDTGECIPATQCPCHHGGKSYKEGDSIKQSCNTCTCQDGLWSCTERTCPATCSAWGNSHYKTFDGHVYDFHGTCDYHLAKGKMSEDDTFSVVIKNIPCGTSKVTCSKATTIKIGSGASQEKLYLIRGKDTVLPTGSKRMEIRDIGSYVFVDIFDLGLTLQWDKGNRIYLTLQPKWKGRVKGLCGNSNGDASDDFATPSGLTEASPLVFGDSWKLHKYCPVPEQIGENTCELHPHRKIWAAKKCAILKSSVFARCHSEVPLQAWYDYCVYDTCGCNVGGDCECLCTAVSAYAQACSEAGVPVKWRDQHICPMQCPKGSSYKSCISTCPLKTCENMVLYKKKERFCKEEPCVEGCAPDPCEKMQVYDDTTSMQCVNVRDCKIKCMMVDDVQYYEGDIMEQDGCHTCTCSNKEKVCQGTPCPPPTEPAPTVAKYNIYTGVKEEVFPTGTETFDNGTIRVVFENGTKEYQNLDGTKITNYVDGSSIKWLLDGSYIKFNLDGSWMKWFVDGSTRAGTKEDIIPDLPLGITTFDNGTELEVFENGTKKYTNVDLSWIAFNLDGSWMKWFLDGSYQKKVVGGTLFTYYHDGSKVSYDETTKKRITYYQNGTRTERQSDGTIIFTGLNGYKTTTKVDGTETVDYEDGRKVIIYFDGSSNTYLKNGTIITTFEDKTTQWFSWKIENTEVCGRPDEACKHIEPPPEAEAWTGQTKESVLTLKCTPGWTHWINNHHPDEQSPDEAEIIQDTSGVALLEGEMNAWCGRAEMTDIECRNAETSALAGEEVTCSLNEGVICRAVTGLKGYTSQMCADYMYRIQCTCQTESEQITVNYMPTCYAPSMPHPQDCHKYRRCAVINGAQTFVEESCGEDLMYNSYTGQCDFPHDVAEVRPACAVAPVTTTTEITPTEIVPVKGCDSDPNDHLPHETDCNAFYHCLHHELVVKHCGPGTLFNPKNKICDHPYNVYKIKPECEGTTKPPTAGPPPTEAPQPKTTPYIPVVVTEGLPTPEAQTIKPIITQEPEEIPAPGECTELNEHTPHETDCNAYNICDNYKFVLHHCSPGLFFNPIAKVCDFPLNVVKVKPQCEYKVTTKPPTAGPQWTRSETTYPPEETTPRPKQSTPGPQEGTSAPIIIQSTASPPPPCQESGLVDLLHEMDIPEFAFTASCSLGGSSPSAAREVDIGIFGRQKTQESYDYSDDAQTDTWVACEDNGSQYLQVDLGKETAVYGVKLTGSYDLNAYVTSYQVMFGDDGQVFSYITEVMPHDDGSDLVPQEEEELELITPKTFRGPFDQYIPVEAIFPNPIEARYIRIIPMTWEINIAMRVEILGCPPETITQLAAEKTSPLPPVTEATIQPAGPYQPETPDEVSTKKIVEEPSQTTKSQPPIIPEVTTDNTNRRDEIPTAMPQIGIRATTPRTIRTTPAIIIVATPAPESCQDDMGISDGTLDPSMIDITSTYLQQPNKYGAQMILLHSNGAWKPATNTISEHITVNFGGLRNLTGIKTQGYKGEFRGEDAWVKAFSVSYSNDGHHWHTIHDPSVKTKTDRIFPGNFDTDTVNTQYFTNVVRAQYLRIRPLKWHISIAMRLEVIGCYEAYEEILIEETAAPPAEGTPPSGITKSPTAGPGRTPARTTFPIEEINPLPTEPTKSPTAGPGRTPAGTTFPIEEITPLPTEPTAVPEDQTTGFLTITSTVSPQIPCQESGLVDLLLEMDIPDNAFTASCSSQGSSPYAAREMDIGLFERQKSQESYDYSDDADTDTWVACEDNESQYLQIDLGKTSTVYGIQLTGSYDLGAYVSSYKVMYGDDESSFSYITYGAKTSANELVKGQGSEQGQSIPKRFRGPFDPYVPVETIFPLPIETRYIRIIPMTWEINIAMRVEILGCPPESIIQAAIEKTTIRQPAETTQTIIEETPETTPHVYIPIDEPIVPETTPTTTLNPQTRPTPAIIIVATPPSESCQDDMGISDGTLDTSMIETSSTYLQQPEKYGTQMILLNSNGAWKPATNTMSEHVTVNFGGPRSLTGIKTQGFKGEGDAGEAWVKAFSVSYSNDGHHWNTIQDPSVKTGRDRIFPGNFDADTINTQYFSRVIKAQYLRIKPLKWHASIGMRLEVIGCYEVYEEILVEETAAPPSYGISPTAGPQRTPVETTYPPSPVKGQTTPRPKSCIPCPAVPLELLDNCDCDNGLLWDGEKCVTQDQCACYEGQIRYEIGAVFGNEDCETCTCLGSGETQCIPKTCAPCNGETHSELTVGCECICKECEVGTTLCPTSSICIPSQQWCDGVEHCPDDELYCPEPTTPAPKLLPTTTPPCEHKSAITGECCPILECQEGYYPVPTEIETMDECPYYKCRPVVELVPHPEPCPEASCRCQPGYTSQIVYPRSEKLIDYSSQESVKGGYGQQQEELRPKREGNCPTCECVPSPTIPTPTTSQPTIASPVLVIDKKCIYCGRSVITFDGEEYKHQMCHHVLAESSLDGWKVEYHKEDNKKFAKVFIGNEVIVLKENLYVEYKDNTYSSIQASRLHSSRLFEIKHIGDSILVESESNNLWVQWENNDYIEIGVPSESKEWVSGLCGNFNDNPSDDKTKRDGKLGTTTKDFTESWKIVGSPDCEEKVCEKSIQDKAWQLCNYIKFPPFNKCKRIVSKDNFLSKCLQSTCECLEKDDKDERDCKCDAFQQYVKQCQTLDQSVHLEDWRSIHHCPAFCPDGQIHRDCFHHSCELTCDNLKNEDSCPALQSGVCFPGCFCPDGLVKMGEKCVEPTACKNCICKKKGRDTYVTFDGKEIQLEREKTYTAARHTSSDGGVDFSVEISTNSNYKIGINDVNIAFGDQSVNIKACEVGKQPFVTSGGNQIKSYPFNGHGIKMKQKTSSLYSLTIESLHVAVDYNIHSADFAIRLPNTLYGGNLEGLCGDCDQNPQDDMKSALGFYQDQTQFLQSWSLETSSKCKSEIIIQPSAKEPEEQVIVQPGELMYQEPVTEQQGQETTSRSIEVTTEKKPVVQGTEQPEISQELEEPIGITKEQETTMRYLEASTATPKPKPEQATEKKPVQQIIEQPEQETTPISTQELVTQQQGQETTPRSVEGTTGKKPVVQGTEEPEISKEPVTQQQEQETTPRSVEVTTGKKPVVQGTEEPEISQEPVTQQQEQETTPRTVEVTTGKKPVVQGTEEPEISQEPEEPFALTKEQATEKEPVQQVIEQLEQETTPEPKPEQATEKEPVQQVIELLEQETTPEPKPEQATEKKPVQQVIDQSQQETTPRSIQVSTEKKSVQQVIEQLGQETTPEPNIYGSGQEPEPEEGHETTPEPNIYGSGQEPEPEQGQETTPEPNIYVLTKECPAEMKQHCQKLLSSTFSKCHAFVDAQVFVTKCEDEVCNNGNNICQLAEEYATECRDNGICFDWRESVGCDAQICGADEHYEECGPGCDENCDDDYCDEPIGPGCYCDEGKVMIDGECRDKKYCTRCTDNKNMFREVDEIWRMDSCTKCTCTEYGSVSCTTEECQSLVCSVGYQAQVVQGVEDKCCPHEVCVPVPVDPEKTCPDIVEPECGEFQEVKTISGSDDCTRYVCDCIADCPIDVSSYTSPLKPGEEYETVNTGCCPKTVKKCVKENCPADISCSEHLIKALDESTQLDCCPTFTCELPQDKCLYTMKNINEGSVIVTEIGKTWSDGACTSCKCEAGRSAKGYSSSKPEHSCEVTQCDTRQQEKDQQNFRLELIKNPGECCASYKKVACKMPSNNYFGLGGLSVYEIGETWASDDPCKTYNCTVNSEGDAEVEIDIEKCKTDCETGFKYKESGNTCCGSCVQTHCVLEDGGLLSSGDRITSPDGCMTTTCEQKNNKLQTVVHEETCAKKTCEIGYHAEEVRGSKGGAKGCCPRIECQPDEKKEIGGLQVCEISSEPTCGEFQKIKSITGEDGCTRYICDCVSDCPVQDFGDTPLQPGEHYVNDSSGCCTKTVKHCSKERCALETEDVECLPHWVRVLDLSTKDQCCPDYICEQPTDKCLYTMQQEKEGSVIAMDVDSTWTDGPCTQCRCSSGASAKGYTPTKPQHSCQVTMCDATQQQKDEQLFRLEFTTKSDKCCATYKKTGCKIGATIYEIGETWSASDPCKTFTCSLRDDGDVEVETDIEKCSTNCTQGFEYKKSEDSCCGSCVPTHCVMADGSLLEPGEVKSSEDECTTTTCTIQNSKPQTTVQTPSCQSLTCEMGYEVKEVSSGPKGGAKGGAKGGSSGCCPQQICIKVSEPLSCDVTQPICGEFMEVKSISEPDSCTKFICECVSDCPTPPADPKDLLPGEEFETVSGGCCPTTTKKCNKVVCPEEPDCPAHLVKIIDPATKDHCCPNHICEKPEDKCLYTMKEENTDSIIAMDIGGTWTDGPCTECTCNAASPSYFNPETKPSASCAVTQCDTSQQAKEEQNFRLEMLTTPGQCCPTYTKVACKVSTGYFGLGQTEEYEIGQTWTKEDPCKTFNCTINEQGDAEIEVDIEKCHDDCDSGFEYRVELGKCCGSCIPTHCVMEDGSLLAPGEETKLDICTTVTCKIQNSKPQTILNTEECHDLICQVGWEVQTSSPGKGGAQTCCPRQTCVPIRAEELKTCPEVTEPKCMEFQEVKTTYDVNNCTKFICDCIQACPTDDSLKEELATGEEYETINDGCCPKLTKKCVKENCPAEAECASHLNKTLDLATKDDCCPQYICDMPKDKCLYTMAEIDEGTVIVKEVGERWTDGPCKKCQCNPAKPTKDCPDKGPRYACSKVRCDKRQEKKDKRNYRIEYIVDPDVCCASYKRTACKAGSKEYEIGETWTSDRDPCKTYNCTLNSDGDAQNEVDIEKCSKDCSLGYEYKEKESKDKCCGSCEPVDCVMEDGSLLAVGTNKTLDQGCTTVACYIQNSKPQLVVHEKSCPVLDCEEKDQQLDQSGCCKICAAKPQSLVTSQCKKLGGQDTIGIVTQEVDGHGQCSNKEEIADWAECKGTCMSGTMYSPKTGATESNCTCCQAVGETTAHVLLECSDGFTLTKEVTVPTACACEACDTKDLWMDGEQQEAVSQLVQQNNQLNFENNF